jgi:hypothetical protein
VIEIQCPGAPPNPALDRFELSLNATYGKIGVNTPSHQCPGSTLPLSGFSFGCPPRVDPLRCDEYNVANPS